MKADFVNSPRPLLVGSLRNRTTAQTIADIRNSELDGAQAFILHIQLLDEQYREPDELKKIFASTCFPVMAIYYRSGNALTDEARADAMLKAVHAGASCVDLPANTFDSDSQDSLTGCTLPFAAANPKEISMRWTTIGQQQEYIEQVHSLGAHVLMSAHIMPAHLNGEQALSLAQEMASRGADIVKIVTTCPSVEHALEMLQVMVELKKKLAVPFVYLCTGPHGALVRPLGPMFGSMLVFGHHDYNEYSNPSKQLLSNMREFYRIMPWRVDDYLE